MRRSIRIRDSYTIVRAARKKNIWRTLVASDTRFRGFILTAARDTIALRARRAELGEGHALVASIKAGVR
jgi:hypothetical protein